jgi:Mg-chelatase subunit ChlD
MLLAVGPAPEAGAARERTGSLDVFVVLDESGSMKPIFGRVTAYLGEALVRDYLAPGDYLCILGFSDVPHVRVSQRLASEAEKENLARIVGELNVTPQGYTDMGRALEELLRQLESLADPSHEQVVLILTDGLNQPPRDSPYFNPARVDSGKGLAPPSRFGEPFLAQVRRLAEKGFRIHVVGIGLETDARTLADALGSAYTILRAFDPQELQAGLARFWDDTIDLVGATPAGRDWLPGQEVAVEVRIRSTSDKERAVELRGAGVSTLEPLLAAGTARPEASALRVSLAQARWPAPPRQETTQVVRVALPEGFPAGDFRATLLFDQASAVKFYPPEADLVFHVPSFWERHGTALVLAAVATSGLLLAAIVYRRRPIAVGLVIEGQTATEAAKPVRLPIAGAASVGGGATDRLRIAGLPPKAATLERRTVERFALVSTRPELLPTLPEYALGEAVEVRTGSGPEGRLVVRFVRAQGGRPKHRPRPQTPPVVSSRPPQGPGGVDFR